MRPARKKRLDFGITAGLCAVFVAGMVGMSFAAVPLYKLFCALTGYNGTTQRAAGGPDAALDRVVTVRFDTNIADGLDWSFAPVERSVKIRVGEVAEVMFRAENRSGRTTSGIASFNVAPDEMGAYFSKISCFCFNEQTLAAGQSRDFPVTFFVDPAIAEDREQDGLDTVTLSYTFFPAGEAATVKPVAAAPVTVGSPL